MNDGARSLLLVTVDCLRADHCGFYGYSRPTTPFLDAVAAESFVAPTAMVAGAPTYYSFPALFASRMPLALGRDVIGLAPGENTLATALHEAGYVTAAFSAANPYLSLRFGYDEGFEVFRDFQDFPTSAAKEVRTKIESVTSAAKAAKENKAVIAALKRCATQNQTCSEACKTVGETGSSLNSTTRGKFNRWLKDITQRAGLGGLYNDLYFEYCVRVAAPAVESIDALRQFPDAEVIVDHAISWLASAGQRPFFLWLHFMDPHSPYYPSKAAFRELTGRELRLTQARYLNEFWKRSDLTAARLQRKRDPVVTLYDASIRWVDTQLARLISYLKERRLWNNCTLALTADHGEEFLEHGRRFHAPVSLEEGIARVPLLLRVSGCGKKKVPETPFSHLHLSPTLLEILGVRAPATFKGRSLWSNLRQELPWQEPAVVECAYGCANPFRPEARLAPRLVSVRDARYKLVIRIEPDAVEAIYDLTTDPEERTPLPVTAEKEVRVRLLQAAHKHLKETADEADAVARLRSRLRDIRVELQHRSRVS